MIVAFNYYDITPTDVNLSDGDWHRITYTCTEYKNYNYVDQEALELMRQGWFNPRKIKVSHQVSTRNHNRVIRSQLPQRIRINHAKELVINN